MLLISKIKVGENNLVRGRIGNPELSFQKRHRFNNSEEPNALMKIPESSYKLMHLRLKWSIQTPLPLKGKIHLSLYSFSTDPFHSSHTAQCSLEETSNSPTSNILNFRGAVQGLLLVLLVYSTDRNGAQG
jgi:hypothetical protein